MKMKMGDLNAVEAGKLLRNFAELTSQNSRDWENFEAIATEMIRCALDAGKASPLPPAHSETGKP